MEVDRSLLRYSSSQDYLLAGTYGLLAAMCVIALASGGWSYSVICLAVLALPRLFTEPSCAVWYSTAFLLIAMAILPQSFRDIGEGTPPEFFFWAIGLFLITAPAVTRILGPRKIRGSGSGWQNVPASLLGYFVICLAASFQGLRLGAEPGYVLRQLYGIVLFIVYFAVAVIYVRSIDDIVILLRKMRVVAACVGVATLILVSADRSGEVGIFKRNISVYMAALACYSFGELLHAKTNRGRLSWGLQVSVFILHPIIFLSRCAV